MSFCKMMFELLWELTVGSSVGDASGLLSILGDDPPRGLAV